MGCWAHNHPGHMNHLGQDRYSSQKPDGFKLQTACRNGRGSHWLDPYAWQNGRQHGQPEGHRIDGCSVSGGPSQAYNVRPPRYLSWLITPITMVYGTYNYSYWGLNTNLKLGGPHIVESHLDLSAGVYSPVLALSTGKMMINTGILGHRGSD